LLCHLCIDSGGKQGKKENNHKSIQAEAKAHCRRELDVATSDTAKIHSKKNRHNPGSKNPIILSNKEGYGVLCKKADKTPIIRIAIHLSPCSRLIVFLPFCFAADIYL